MGNNKLIEVLLLAVVALVVTTVLSLLLQSSANFRIEDDRLGVVVYGSGAIAVYAILFVLFAKYISPSFLGNDPPKDEFPQEVIQALAERNAQQMSQQMSDPLREISQTIATEFFFWKLHLSTAHPLFEGYFQQLIRSLHIRYTGDVPVESKIQEAAAMLGNEEALTRLLRPRPADD